MTKGQVYLNGEHVCRYFVATPSGGVLPGPPAIDLPASLLRRHGNELTLFDEHGGRSHARAARGRSLAPSDPGRDAQQAGVKLRHASSEAALAS